MTVVGFIVHYTHYLDPFRHEAAAATSPSLLSPSSPSPEPLSHRDPTPSRRPLILLAGYSYGAFVTTLLPPLHDYSSGNGGKGILSTHFARPRHGTPAAEVRLRAEHLAARQNAILGEEARGRQRMEEERLAAVAAESSASSGQLSPRRAISGSVRVGGEEDVRRNSHDSGHRRTGSHAQHQRHSFDIDRERLRNSVRSLVGKSASPASVGSACGESLAGGTNGKKKSPSDRGAKVRGQDGKGEQDEDDEFLSPVHGMAAPRVAYLLVSPLQGLVTNLATMSFGSVSAAVGSALGGLFSSKRKQEDEDPRAARPSKKSEGQNKSLASQSSQDSTAATADDLEKVLAERKLTENPTLAVYGDGDVFVAARRLRDWATRLRAVENSRFRAREVPGAGHFWVEGRSLYVLRDAVRNFAEGLLVGDCTDDESVQSEGYEPL